MTHIQNMMKNHQLWCVWDEQENEMVEALYETEKEAHTACDLLEHTEGYGDPDGCWTRFNVAGYYHA